LLSPKEPTTTTTQPKPSGYIPVTVFFLSSSDLLQPEPRDVLPPAPLVAVIRSMLAGPSESESTAGVITAIPNNVVVISAVPTGSQVTVNFNNAFSQITGSNTELAVSQVVATVASYAGNGTGVTFEINGQRTSVPIAGGASVSGPVYLLDFVGPPH
jgi:spore germination protein GerM